MFQESMDKDKKSPQLVGANRPKGHLSDVRT